ncbi:inositol monophosphatase [Fulvivirga ulvae]|uniref:3'(2'),5'-bisphosphate nucleotidase CysQ family protein n=1 Tax=Fulvivirga ulvae TaxID=2904245 RepID=UPI001F2E4CE6|nr:inositol monophosphatase family protein [Fulvivirga ulvae]UII31096.1 inositol monophosphatase [Fulvivirga ulvae]
MILSEKELKALCQMASTAALDAGKYIQSQFDRSYAKKHKKGGNSLASQVVTEIDEKAQEIILRHLHSSLEAHNLGLLTEEAIDDQSRLEKAYFWCIDPMDGTLPFTEKRTGYAVSIALIANSGDPVIGVVYVPDLAECYTSVKGDGVWLNDKSFVREKGGKNDIIHVYSDRSLRDDVYYKSATDRLNEWAAHQNTGIQYHTGFGSVRNALGVMTSGTGCYFKFPKRPKGGGSIWDYAATRLFFEELGLHVSDARGETLQLNNPETTFMNEVGVIYTTDSGLSDLIITLGN